MYFNTRNTMKKLLAFTLAAGVTLSACPVAQPEMAAQLNIILNDEACKQAIAFVKSMQSTLEKTLESEMRNSPQLADKISDNITNTLITFCTLGELLKIKKSKEPLIKLFIAFCVALETFIAQAAEEYKHLAPESKPLLDKLANAVQQFKAKIWGSVTIQSANNNSNNGQSIDTLVGTIVSEGNELIASQPFVKVNNLPFSLNMFSNQANQFSVHFKNAMAKTLSASELATLSDFFSSTAYTRVKYNKEKVLGAIVASLSPETKQKAGAMLVHAHKQLALPVGTLLKKVESLQK